MNFRARSAAELPRFQIAPMIDVVFLLLCFFITAQVFAQWETEIGIKLPTAESGAPPRRLPGEIILNVMADGRVILNGRELDDATLRDRLKRVAELFPSQPVLIRADKATDYEHVIRVLDACRKVQIWNISFATRRVD
jgi:biopolymer transport protein ExbD